MDRTLGTLHVKDQDLGRPKKIEYDMNLYIYEYKHYICMCFHIFTLWVHYTCLQSSNGTKRDQKEKFSLFYNFYRDNVRVRKK